MNINPEHIILETDRLLLRDITMDDLEDMYTLHSDPLVQKYTGEPIVDSIEKMSQAIEARLENTKKQGYSRWATLIKDTQEFIGWSGLAYLPEFDVVDLGYRFMPQYWGKGYATEAAKAILQYGFKTLGLEEIFAIALKEHKATMRVMEKSGMVFYKIGPYEPSSIDAVWYRSDRASFIMPQDVD